MSWSRIAFASISLVLISTFVTSCGGGYDGYQTRSYTIRGIRYHPLSVDQALSYSGEGIASWYDESKLFGFMRGNTSLGEKVMPFAVSGAHKTLPLSMSGQGNQLEKWKVLEDTLE